MGLLNAEITITLLEDMGLIVERVEDGIQCVAKMEQMPAKSYDLILMDVQMPVRNGFEATKIIRELNRPDAKKVVIYACTANTFKEDQEQAQKSGMDGFIAKPIDVNKLIQMLKMKSRGE